MMFPTTAELTLGHEVVTVLGQHVCASNTR